MASVTLNSATPEAALEYLESWGLDPKRIRKDGWDRNGYFVLDAVAHWPGQFVRWPEHFNFDTLLAFMEPQVFTTAQLANQADRAGFASKVGEVTDSIKQMLVDKNAAYGNAALDPVRVFSQATPEEQILVRIDDKLSRIQRGHEFADEDTVNDLIGYLILLKIARA